MGAFKDFKTKASVIAAETYQMFLGQAVYTDDDVANLAKESYERNVWAYACVKAIATAASSIPLIVYQKNGDEIQEIYNHPLQKLLDRPNDVQGRAEFIQEAMSYIQISGNNYIELNGPTKNGLPVNLYNWRPDRTTLVVGKDGPKYARYTVNGIDKDLDFKRIVHTKHFSALNDFYGMSPVHVGRYSIDLDNATNDWNTALMQNSAQPSGILKSQKVLPKPEFNRLKAMLKSKFGGKKNAGKTHLLEGGLEWQQLGLSPKDMDFVLSRKMTREEICALYRVPPQIAGIHETSTYNNYTEARRAFYQDTVLPELEKLISSLNHKLSPMFGDNIYIGYKREEIEALQESANDLYKRLADVKDIMTINERRQSIGKDEVPNGDVFVISNSDSLVPINNQSGIEEIPKDDPTEKMRNIYNNVKDINTKENQSSKRKKDEERVLKLLDKHEKKLTDLIQRKMFEQRDKLIAAETFSEIELGNIIESTNNEWIEEITASCIVGYEESFNAEKKIMERRAKHIKAELGEYDFPYVEEEIHSYIYDYVAIDVVAVSLTTKERIMFLVGESIAAGETVNQLAKRINQMYEHEFDMERAKMIARTEMLSAISSGRQRGAKSLGIPLTKTWASDGSKRVRPTHREASGQTVGMDDYYIVGEERGMFPGDPMFSGKERIRCRCTEFYDVI